MNTVSDTFCVAQRAVRAHRVLIAVAAWASFPTSATSALPLDEWADQHAFEKQVVEHRERLTSGDATIHVTRTRQGQSQLSKYRIRFDGQQLRNDVQQSLRITEVSGDTQQIDDTTCYYIFSREQQASWIDHVSDEGRNVAVTLYHLNSDQGRRLAAKRDQAYRLDLRRFGAIPAGHSALYDTALRDFLTRPDRRSSSMVEVTEGGRELVALRYERNDGRIITYIIDPKRDYSVVRSSIEVPGRFTDAIECELAEFGDVWYPKSVRYTRSHQGVVGIETNATVVRAEFNEHIDPAVFELASLPIPVGLHAAETPRHPKGTRYWDGKQFVPGKQLRVQNAAPPLSEKQPNHRSYSWLILANVFLVLSLGCWWLARNRRSGKSSHG
ncbi:MAG: hypothetical protein ACF8TS_21865 [Maioricimonas sp. JB049]